MMESFNSSEKFEYHKLTLEEQSKRGILGRLQGIIADGKKPTRNGRKYSIELWEKVFNDPIMKEKIENRVCLGELGHPADRTETLIEKAALCLAEVPKKGSDGLLYGVFDILDTPCGRILKTLCDYGCNIGVSSRGQGDTFTDFDGQESVDPDTYDCECFDAVLLPAVKAARLQYVTESFDNSKNNLKKALNEALDKASEDEKKIMEDKLKELDIDYSPEMVYNIDADSKNIAANNDGAELVANLQEALKEKQDLEKQLTDLQEKLSVSYAKEIELKESIEKYKNSIISLTESSKRVKALENQVSVLSSTITGKDNIISEQNKLIKNLHESRRDSAKSHKELNESINNKDARIKALNEEVEKLRNDFKTEKSKSESKQKTLIENIEELKTDSAIKHSEYSKKIKKANELVEKYKTIAKSAVIKYIESQAIRIGVDKNEIKNRLSENYTFSDIDNICEELQSYKINMSKLPFDISKTKKLKMSVTESKEPIMPVSRFDDDIDEQLSSLAGL